MDKTEGETWHQHGIFPKVRSMSCLCQDSIKSPFVFRCESSISHVFGRVLTALFFMNEYTHLQNYHLSEKFGFYFQYLLTINDRAYVAIAFKYPDN